MSYFGAVVVLVLQLQATKGWAVIQFLIRTQFTATKYIESFQRMNKWCLLSLHLLSIGNVLNYLWGKEGHFLHCPHLCKSAWNGKCGFISHFKMQESDRMESNTPSVSPGALPVLLPCQQSSSRLRFLCRTGRDYVKETLWKIAVCQLKNMIKRNLWEKEQGCA